MADDNDNEAKGKGKSGMIVTIAIVLVLSMIAAGGGWMLGGVLAPQVAQPEETAAIAEGGAEDAAEGGR